jgi:Lrp/AsnC family leucine-responsive transcriptional regulator
MMPERLNSTRMPWGYQMDEKDRQIIRVLQSNARITNLDLAAAVNLSPSPCLQRVRILEESGVIAGYSAIVDAKSFGLEVTAFVQVKLVQHSAEIVENFEKRVMALDEVIECYLISGQSDYILRVMVASLVAYEHFIRHKLHHISGISSIDSRFVYGAVKQTPGFPIVSPMRE